MEKDAHSKLRKHGSISELSKNNSLKLLIHFSVSWGLARKPATKKKLRRLDDTNFQISVSRNMNPDPPPEKKTERELDPHVQQKVLKQCNTNTCTNL
jgi:hypothetical protein